MAIKTFVQVGHETDELGSVVPLWLCFRGQKYPIDRVLEVRPAAALNAGGHGLRYTVRIRQRKAYLFLDDFNRWFVEEKVAHEIPRVGGLVQGNPYSF